LDEKEEVTRERISQAGAQQEERSETYSATLWCCPDNGLMANIPETWTAERLVPVTNCTACSSPSTGIGAAAFPPGAFRVAFQLLYGANSPSMVVAPALTTPAQFPGK
jgi:hypothetical protein